MRQHTSRLALLVLICLILSWVLPAQATQEDALAQTGQYLLQTVSAPKVGSIGGEWAVIGLARSSLSVPQSYYSGYYQRLCDTLRQKQGVLHEKKYTEYSRVVLALTAIGRDPASVAGYNLLTPLGDFDKTVWQGVNGAIWALLALDSGGYDMPQNASARTQATRQLYVEHILSCQQPDGGWNLSGSAADPDLTAMALQALNPYRGQSAVSAAVERGLACLSALQLPDGGFAAWGDENAESAAQVVVMLATLGLAQDDARFVKDGNTPYSALLRYCGNGGGFSHLPGGELNAMATEQGFYALVAAQRAAAGQPGLFDMRDVTPAQPEEPAGLPDLSDVVHVPPVSLPGIRFSDLDGCANAEAILALAARGIVTGAQGAAFLPNEPMTRAQCAAMLTRALGLPEAGSCKFTDVSSSAWYSGPLASANACGVALGVGRGLFLPENRLTRQEAATMTARAGRLCGMQVRQELPALQDILAQVPDYRTIAGWAQAGMAFCYEQQLIRDEGVNSDPTGTVTRAEAAQMVYDLLCRAQLL